MGKTREDIRKLVGDVKLAFADGKVSFAELQTISGDVTQLIVDLQDLRTDPADEADIIAFAKEAYDAHVSPVDLRGIPDWLETMIDNGIKTAVEQGIRAGFAKLRKAA